MGSLSGLGDLIAPATKIEPHRVAHADPLQTADATALVANAKRLEAELQSATSAIVDTIDRTGAKADAAVPRPSATATSGADPAPGTHGGGVPPRVLIEDVKGQPNATAFLTSMKSQAKLRVMRGAQGKATKIRLSAVFAGPPNVGKQLTAKAYATMLADVGAIKSSNVTVLDARRLLAEGQSLAEAVKAVTAGVIFIENAHVLSARNPAELKALGDAARRDSEPVIVLAGEPNVRALVDSSWQLDDAFANQIDFKALGADVLTGIFKNEAASMGYTLDAAAEAAAGGRLLSAGRAGANAAMELLTKAEKRLGERLFSDSAKADPTVEEMSALSAADLQGDSPFDANGKLKQLARLDEQTGQVEMKEWIYGLVDTVINNLARQAEGKVVEPMNLNAIIKGPPGTGKTSCIEILNDILTALGLRSGKIVYVTAAELKGATRGEAEKLVADAYARSEGGLLVIDEAHQLGGDEFGHKALETLVPLSYNGFAHTSVFLLGYQGPMDELLNVDTGLKSRFPVENVVNTTSFKREELAEILTKMVNKAQYELGPGAVEAAMQNLDVQRLAADFGNARSCENLKMSAIRKLSRRNKTLPPKEKYVLQAADFGTTVDLKAAAFAKLDPLVGMEKVRLRFDKLQMFFEDVVRDGGIVADAFEPYNSIVGPTGSGRKTVAGIQAKIFNAFGAIGPGEPVFADALSLKADFTGQTKTNVRLLVERSLGKALVLTGVGGLAKSKDGFTDEAIQALKDQLTKYRGRLAVTLVGTPDEVAAFLGLDADLAALFTSQISLDAIGSSDATTVFNRTLTGYDKKLAPDAAALLPDLVADLAKLPGWSNGLDIGTVARSVLTEHSTVRRKPEHEKDDPKVISLEALQAGFKARIDAKNEAALAQLKQQVQDFTGALSALPVDAAQA